MGRKKRPESCKIFSRVSPESYKRLNMIREKYGFKSNYEIMQYLMHCFLRVADPEHDVQIDPIPYDIEQMFNNLSEHEKHLEYIKPKRRVPHKDPDNE